MLNGIKSKESKFENNTDTKSSYTYHTKLAHLFTAQWFFHGKKLEKQSKMGILGRKYNFIDLMSARLRLKTISWGKNSKISKLTYFPRLILRNAFSLSLIRIMQSNLRTFARLTTYHLHILIYYQRLQTTLLNLTKLKILLITSWDRTN